MACKFVLVRADAILSLRGGRHLKVSVTLCKAQVESEVGLRNREDFFRELCKFRFLTPSLLGDNSDSNGSDGDYNNPSENILLLLLLEGAGWPTHWLTATCVLDESWVKLS